MPPVAPLYIKVISACYNGPGVQIAACSGATVDHWRFKRSLISGGPYAVIGLSPNAVFIDLDVSHGQTLFYVVSVVNQTGESPNSAEASITIPETA